MGPKQKLHAEANAENASGPHDESPKGGGRHHVVRGPWGLGGPWGEGSKQTRLGGLKVRYQIAAGLVNKAKTPTCKN